MMKLLKRLALVFWLTLYFVSIGSSIAAAQDCRDEDNCEKAPAKSDGATGLAGGLLGLAAAAIVTRRFSKDNDSSTRWGYGVLGEDLIET